MIMIKETNNTGETKESRKELPKKSRLCMIYFHLSRDSLEFKSIA